MEIPKSSSQAWIKYVIGGALIVVGIGLLFVEKTTFQILGNIIIGIGIGKLF